jgi:hypothetical protein
MYVWGRHTSGAKYSGVPTQVAATEREELSKREMPKSPSRTSPFLVKKIFWGLRSRCRT